MTKESFYRTGAHASGDNCGTSESNEAARTHALPDNSGCAQGGGETLRMPLNVSHLSKSRTKRASTAEKKLFCQSFNCQDNSCCTTEHSEEAIRAQ
eukprot:11801169-Karenia_brevis.AAC.1